MVVNILVLFAIVIGVGIVTLYVPKINGENYKLLLVFAGFYLFSITIIHIFPELYSQSVSPEWIGICVLGGFFFQHALEFLSSGVEHGHIHVHELNRNHQESSAIWILVALCIHSLLEGGLLAHPRAIHSHHDSNTLLYGIILHKIPEAFALMSVLLCEIESKIRAFLYLLIFAVASPLGLYLSDYLLTTGLMSHQAFAVLFAIVSGNFLHISTTIVFESSTNHKFNSKKMSAALMATLIAVATELFS